MRRHTLILLLLVVLPYGALLTVNLIDYARFHLAVRRVEKLSEGEITALSNYCRKVDGHYRPESKNIPSAFQPLRPINVDLDSGTCDALLYELGEVYLWARIDTSPTEQSILYFTNSTGPQSSRVVWNQNPAHVRELSPEGRVVTVGVWNMAESFEWVVLPDRIIVIDRPETVGSSDKLLASAPLSAADLALIKAAIHEIDPSARGKHFTSGALDGTHLHIRFGTNGAREPNDIAIENTWVEGVGPLLRAISSAGPKEHPITFEQTVKERDSTDARQYVTTLAEREARYYRPRTPWWCVWRSFQRL